MPGGGEFADAVREHDRRFGLRPQTAHWMAILAMDQFGWALADLIPGAARCADLGPVRDGAVSVLLPAALLAERDPLPASWAVTSDSIAAWVAGAAGAERLVLVKPVAGLYRELAAGRRADRAADRRRARRAAARAASTRTCPRRCGPPASRRG